MVGTLVCSLGYRSFHLSLGARARPRRAPSDRWDERADSIDFDEDKASTSGRRGPASSSPRWFALEVAGRGPGRVLSDGRGRPSGIAPDDPTPSAPDGPTSVMCFVI